MNEQQIATLAGGCFWCLEAAYQEVKGVSKVVPGYAGGQRPNPTYEQVVSGATGHAETVQITFDPSVISYASILRIFWVLHDPTTLNRQGHDVGTQYRSVIFYHDPEQKQQAQVSVKDAQSSWPNPIVTQIVPLETFYEAEPEHHNYFKEHPESAYCQVVINPKLAKLRQELAEYL